MISPLFTDLYQLTMAYGYWKLNMHDRDAVFQLIFRKNPFQGNYTLAAGLETAIKFLQDWHFNADDLHYQSTLKSRNGVTLFPAEFLDYLGQLKFTCDVDAIPEGTVVFPHEPLIRITGPLLQGQLVESTLLNIINYQSLIATKASRVYRAAGGAPVLEFGLRRAQGLGALAASRAAFIGGCEGTSNVLAGKEYGIPVRGTHAHSWVTAFGDEKSAFAAYAKVMPHNCVLLVDTFDTVLGIEHAIEIGKQLKAEGNVLSGIRLDSGDLAALSIKARKMLDEAGFEETRIVASNSLDEYAIENLRSRGSQISTYGVGTNLVTAYDHPALDGVYKLSALRDEKGEWVYKLKLSEQPVKISNPGMYQVRRFFSDEQLLMDIMYDIGLGISEDPEMIILDNHQQKVKVGDFDACVDLLQPILRKGQLVQPFEPITQLRARAIDEVQQFAKNQKDTTYLVGLEQNLFNLKQKLIKDLQATIK